MIDRFGRFVSFLKSGDMEEGIDMLGLLKSLPVKETREFGFSLVETAMFLRVMLSHQNRLRHVEAAVRALEGLSQSSC